MPISPFEPSQVIVFHSHATLTLPADASFTPEEINAQFPHPPLRYRDFGQNIAFVVLLWCALPFVLLSCLSPSFSLSLARAMERRAALTEPGLGGSRTLLLYLSSRSDLLHGPRPRDEWTPSSSPYDLSPSPSASAMRHQPSLRDRPAGVFYWTTEPEPDEEGEVVNGVEELGESRSSDETAVGMGRGVRLRREDPPLRRGRRESWRGWRRCRGWRGSRIG
jgi:hypothetical protein